jgi:tRNA(fMet)-specific endonuclease VapC
MTYLLDTNVCIEFLRQPDSLVKRKLTDKAQGDVVLCSIVKAELFHGAKKSARSDHNLELMREFFAAFDSLPFDDDAAQIYGDLRAFLETSGELIGPHDLLIAATALAHGVTLVTHNTNEFKRVPGLEIEDWQT